MQRAIEFQHLVKEYAKIGLKNRVLLKSHRFPSEMIEKYFFVTLHVVQFIYGSAWNVLRCNFRSIAVQIDIYSSMHIWNGYGFSFFIVLSSSSVWQAIQHINFYFCAYVNAVIFSVTNLCLYWASRSTVTATPLKYADVIFERDRYFLSVNL